MLLTKGAKPRYAPFKKMFVVYVATTASENKKKNFKRRKTK